MPRWSESSERLLLLSIIQHASVTTSAWDAIATDVGGEVTANACKCVKVFLSLEILLHVGISASLVT
jgi:hypothetical protein